MALDVVWNQTVDQGAFRCWVERTGERTGVLIVTHVATGDELLHQDVHLAWGALFGPDVDDVARWQDKSLIAIDVWIEAHK